MGLKIPTSYYHCNTLLYPYVMPLHGQIFTNSFIFEKKKHIIIKGRGFQGGSDEKIRRMWLGREIVVAGLPLLDHDITMIP